jgi:hypothetical protein
MASSIAPISVRKTRPRSLPITLPYHHQSQCLIALAVANLWTLKPFRVRTAKPLSRLSVIRASPCIDRHQQNFSALPVFTTKMIPATTRSVLKPKNAPFITTKLSRLYRSRAVTSAEAGRNQSKIGVSKMSFCWFYSV